MSRRERQTARQLGARTMAVGQILILLHKIEDMTCFMASSLTKK